jgi:hypothetical protein
VTSAGYNIGDGCNYWLVLHGLRVGPVLLAVLAAEWRPTLLSCEYNESRGIEGRRCLLFMSSPCYVKYLLLFLFENSGWEDWALLPGIL